MERKEGGTMEHTFSEKEECSLVDQVIKDANKECGIQEEQKAISLHSILKEEFQIWVREQIENSDGKLSGNEWDGKDKINNWSKKFEHRLEQILYKGVVDALKTPDKKNPEKKVIMLPNKAKESVLFLVGLGDAGKKYQKELEQLIKCKAIPNDALKYISKMIQLIFLNKEGMAVIIQGYINIKGSSQTKEMIEKLKKFSEMFTNTAAKIAAITDISAYNKINKALDECNEKMHDVFVEWCFDDRELPSYDSWIRQKLTYAFFAEKELIGDTFLDALNDVIIDIVDIDV